MYSDNGFFLPRILDTLRGSCLAPPSHLISSPPRHLLTSLLLLLSSPSCLHLDLLLDNPLVLSWLYSFLRPLDLPGGLLSLTLHSLPALAPHRLLDLPLLFWDSCPCPSSCHYSFPFSPWQPSCFSLLFLPPGHLRRLGVRASPLADPAMVGSGGRSLKSFNCCLRASHSRLPPQTSSTPPVSCTPHW